MAKKLLIIVTASAPHDKATVALTIANASLSAGMEVALFASSDGVDLAREGNADVAHFKPFKPLSDLLGTFVANGGKLLACGSCLQHRGLTEKDVVEGASVSGVASVVEWIAAGASTLCF